MPRAVRSLLPIILAVLWGTFSSLACVFDADHKCGDQLVPNKAGYCVCPPGSVAKPGNGGVCVSTAQGQGVACDAAAPSCPEPKFGLCQAAPTGGYCTNVGCLTSQDCTGGYACRKTQTGTFCRRPPLGLDKPCASNDDCAGTEATLCAVMFTNRCVVQGCDLKMEGACHDGSICCDLSRLGFMGTVCVPGGTCP